MKTTSRRKRLSRPEAQAQTREHLVEAAKRLFIECGFAGTSLRDIAEEAGYSQGAFYSNFPCKEAVLLELLKRHVALEDDEIETIVADRNHSPEQILAKLEEWLTRFEKGPGLVGFDYRASVARDEEPVIRRKLRCRLDGA